MKHVKDPQRFESDLNAPPRRAVGQPVTEEDLAADGESFMAFASAFGIKPPPIDGSDQAEDLSSAPAS